MYFIVPLDCVKVILPLFFHELPVTTVKVVLPALLPETLTQAFFAANTDDVIDTHITTTKSNEMSLLNFFMIITFRVINFEVAFLTSICIITQAF